MNASTTMRAEGAFKRTLWRQRLSKFVLSGIAVLFTVAPLLSAGLWINNVYFSDPRETLALTPIAPPAAPPDLWSEPIVSVTFDDGWESIYSQAAPILDEYNIRTTQYILSGQFDHYNYLSKEQVLSLQSAGHDIQSHTITHPDLTQVNDQQLQAELGESKRDISKLIQNDVDDFASPLSSYDERTIQQIKTYYRSHRNTEASVKNPTKADYNTKQSFDIYQIMAFSVRRTTTTEDITHFLSKARELNAWAVLVYHEIDPESLSYYAVTPHNFRLQMQAVARSNLRIATVDEVVDTYEKRQAVARP